MLTIDDILKILPHRYPFLLVDGVSELSEERIVAFKQVSFNEPQFGGHFPGRPVMPGVLLVEGMAQTGGILAHHCGAFNPETQLLLFMTINEAKFRKPVFPGVRVDMEVVPLRKGRVWKMRGTSRVEETVVAQAMFTATVVSRGD